GQPDDDERATQGGGSPTAGRGAPDGGGRERTGAGDAALGWGLRDHDDADATRRQAVAAQLLQRPAAPRRATAGRKDAAGGGRYAERGAVAPGKAPRDLQRVDGQLAAGVEGGRRHGRPESAAGEAQGARVDVAGARR